ncbi:MAG TPA: hypothetical protein VIJ79_00400 [Acidobacteriaceae bacterium]
MAEIRIAELSTGFSLYFETPEERINAYALASALVALADAAKIAARRLDATIDIEIVVEALNSGSFRARVTAIAREGGMFVKNQLVTGLILGVLSSYVYDHTLNKKEPTQVIVNTDEVIITQGNDRIIVPRNVHDATQVVATDPAFVQSVDRMLKSALIDSRVTGFGISPNSTGPPPELILPRDLLAIPEESIEIDERKNRIVEEDSDLYIVKAIMEESNRMWGFRWRGVSISAPIKDPNFYKDFASHSFTIAPGDEFQAKLAIHQTKDDVSGVYKNTKYEVLTVYRHISKPRTGRLPLN